MTQEEKRLLLIDLCARLPYHDLWVQYDNKDWLAIGYGHGRIELLPNIFSSIAGPCPLIDEIKPYLRPMSNMTEEELRDFAKIKFEGDAVWEIVEFPEMKCYKGFINVKCKNKNNGDTWIFQVNTRTPLETYYGIDWLNEHHFDYRGLIAMGLALEALEGMYKTEFGTDWFKE